MVQLIHYLGLQHLLNKGYDNFYFTNHLFRVSTSVISLQINYSVSDDNKVMFYFCILVGDTVVTLSLGLQCLVIFTRLL